MLSKLEHFEIFNVLNLRAFLVATFVVAMCNAYT